MVLNVMWLHISPLRMGKKLVHWSLSKYLLSVYMIYAVILLCSAVDGEDFTEPSMFNVTFPAFTTVNNDVRCTYIGIIDDMELEGDEQTFNVSIANIYPSNVLSDDSVAHVRIQDNNRDGNYKCVM